MGPVTEVRAKSTAGFMSVQEYRRQHDLRVEGSNPPDPLQTFESVGFPPDILDEVHRDPLEKEHALNVVVHSVELFEYMCRSEGRDSHIPLRSRLRPGQ